MTLSKRNILIIGLLIALIAVGIYKFVTYKNKPADALSTKVQANLPIELTVSDVFNALSISMTQGLPISGTLKATRSAMIKARVAGELVSLEVREGDAVRAGQIIAKVDPTEYLAKQRQAQQQAEAARAQVEIAQRQFDNNNALVNQGFISKTALDTSIANLNAAKATHQAAISALDVASKAVDDCSLKSPLNGFISQRLAQTGERVAPDTRIVEVLDLSQFELEATLTPADALSVKVGQPAKLNIEGSTQEVSAKVLRINPSAQVGSRSVLIYLGIQGHPALRHGLFVQGSLGTQKIQTVVIPLESVRTDKSLPYVQVAQDGKVVHLKVSLGAKAEVDGKVMMAVPEIAEGTQVLAMSAGALREGALIKLPTQQK
jgi:RND family efflux transporter MFP subunit